MNLGRIPQIEFGELLLTRFHDDGWWLIVPVNKAVAGWLTEVENACYQGKSNKDWQEVTMPDRWVIFASKKWMNKDKFASFLKRWEMPEEAVMLVRSGQSDLIFLADLAGEKEAGKVIEGFRIRLEQAQRERNLEAVKLN